MAPGTKTATLFLAAWAFPFPQDATRAIAKAIEHAAEAALIFPIEAIFLFLLFGAILFPSARP
jgi:hypothetical protein